MIDKQIKAARSFLGWTREELVEASGLSLSTVQNIEEGQSTTQKTIDKAKRALEKNGVVFTDDGIRFPSSSVIRLEGKDWFVEVLQDIFNTLKNKKNKEVLIFGADDRASPPNVVKGFQNLTSSGVVIREMIEEGNSFIMGDEENYRWIPKDYFKNYVTVIYGDKVVQDFGTYGVLFFNKDVAEARRNEFEYLWSKEKPLKIKSSADVRYKV
ncbi:MAG: hypothetical protein DI551_05345 [Micavibrio aeruginosavorus]|uniref:HTH cro/C1-type domain-containing protein n=1 Tax=Micavibrio aeruginosavorus TaxID=349221 RepID=A0A2W5MYJ6_9BACT|nr:MAG: hypothetical protein DI551_05345 [Micavibrio aeruginosavorus]